MSDKYDHYKEIMDRETKSYIKEMTKLYIKLVLIGLTIFIVATAILVALLNLLF